MHHGHSMTLVHALVLSPPTLLELTQSDPLSQTGCIQQGGMSGLLSEGFQEQNDLMQSSMRSREWARQLCNRGKLKTAAAGTLHLPSSHMGVSSGHVLQQASRAGDFCTLHHGGHAVVHNQSPPLRFAAEVQHHPVPLPQHTPLPEAFCARSIGLTQQLALAIHALVVGLLAETGRWAGLPHLADCLRPVR